MPGIFPCPNCQQIILCSLAACPYCNNPVPNHIREIEARDNRKALLKRDVGQVLAGIFLIVLGVVATVISYGLATTQICGGRYFVTIGLPIVGGIFIIKGVVGLIINSRLKL